MNSFTKKKLQRLIDTKTASYLKKDQENVIVPGYATIIHGYIQMSKVLPWMRLRHFIFILIKISSHELLLKHLFNSTISETSTFINEKNCLRCWKSGRYIRIKKKNIMFEDKYNLSKRWVYFSLILMYSHKNSDIFVLFFWNVLQWA